jgi:hypothetical protein
MRQNLRRSNRHLALWHLAPACFLLVGCSPVKQSPELTVESARQSLIAMVESGEHADLKMSLDLLRSAEAVKSPDGAISFGPWNCDLKNRSFVVTLVAGPMLAEYRGEFVLAADQKWTARITKETRN